MIASPIALIAIGLLLVLLTVGVLHAIGIVLLVIGVIGLLGFGGSHYGRNRGL